MSRSVATMALLMTIGGSKAIGKQPVSAAGVPVRLYVTLGRVPISGPAIVAAQWQASRLFEKADIRLEWLSGEPNDADTGPFDVHIAFIPEAPPAFRRRGGLSALAATTLYSDRPATINVFGDRIRDCFLQYGANDPMTGDRLSGKILGHVLAHEIAHVLEGVPRHSEGGVMKACWTREDFRTIMSFGLSFASEDLTLLHAAFLWRH